MRTDTRSTTDPAQGTAYKAEQRRQWEGAARELRVWWPAFERLMGPVTQTMVTDAGIGPGAHVLDVASGFGEPALTVARIVGTSGRVLATDLSPSMLAVAAERAGAAGLSNVDLAEMDAEQPMLDEAGFAAVVCRLGLMFLPDLDAALDRLTALLVPGGRFVAAVWGPPAANTWLTVARQTLTEYLELSPSPPGTPNIFGLAPPGVADGALVRAGLDDVRLTPVRLHCDWSSTAAYTAFHRASPLCRIVAGEGRGRQAQAWREVTAAAGRRWGRGPLHLEGEVLVVSGQRR